MTIELSISTDYVLHWGVWEAVRELIQNAIDQQVEGHTYTVYDHAAGLHIENTGPGLDVKMLLLGKTSKSGNTQQIGSFGEGLKLALLVLCRLQHNPVIITGDQVWRPNLSMSDTFGCEVLKVDITPCDQDDIEPFEGTRVVLESVCLDDIKDKFKPELPLNEPIEAEIGNMYVKGLFVCKIEGFKYGYNFTPDRIQLDRDRGTIDGFEVGIQTSRVWSEKFGKYSDKVLSMVDKKVKDVEYITYYASPSTPLARSLVAEYKSAHGIAIPVSTQEEIQAVQASGKKWKLVSDTLKHILWQSVGYFIPSVGTPKQRLEAFIAKHKSELSNSQVAELTSIVEVL